jgi:hypothetical protein
MRTLLLRAAALAAARLPFPIGATPLTLETALDLADKRSDTAPTASPGTTSASEAAHAEGLLAVGIGNLPARGAAADGSRARCSCACRSGAEQVVSAARRWVGVFSKCLRS